MALSTTGLAQAPTSSPPAPPAADDEVDIVTSAGKPESPPKREASIVLSGGPDFSVRWDPAWRRFGLADYVATGLSAAAAFGTLAIPPAKSRWTHINSFDAEIRNALRVEDEDDRFRARDASDITLMLSLNQILVDTLIVTWWGHDAGTVAYEMALMNIEAFAFNSAINGLVAAVASRERPYRDMCVGDDATELKDCRGSKRYRSFYSGHTSTTFAVAGLTCMHHAYLPLYGGGAPDVLVCFTSFGIAAATGTLRIASDQHFGSDVIVGALLGTTSGLAVPYFLHYRTGDLPDKPGDDAISVQLLPTPTGAYVLGAF